ncbi:MAG: hypothetical protein WCV41_03950 [Patescibacteria group bacterium]
MTIKKLPNLPAPGSKFRATTGLGNFAKKLKLASRWGELKNIQDNLPAVNQTVKKYESYIKYRGGLTRLQKRQAWRDIKTADKNITVEDKREIKKILDHLGQERPEEKNISKTAENKKEAFPGLFSFKQKAEPKPIPYYRRALATADSEITKKTGVSIFDSRGGASQVSVDTRAQGGKTRSGINPITGGVSSISSGQKPLPARPSIPLAR